MILAAWDWSVILGVGSVVVALVIGVSSIVIGLKALGVATKQTALAERQTALAEKAMRPLLWLHPASYDPKTALSLELVVMLGVPSREPGAGAAARRVQLSQ